MEGKIPENVLEALLETIPVELSVLDANDELMAFNKPDTRIFKRPPGALGRNVRKCHPEKSIDKVLTIISEMRAGKRDKARFWIDLPLGPNGEKHKVLIDYYALRDKDGKYLGCLEASQDIDDYRKIEGQQRLLD